MSVTGYLYPISFSLFTLMAWIGTCVSFGGVLVTFSVSGNTGSGYYDHVSGNLGARSFSGSWSDLNDITQSSTDCTGAGKGLVAMLVFAFLSTLATLVLLLLSVSKLNHKISFLSSATFIASLEFALTATSTFFYFLAVCVWGGACYTGLRNTQGLSSVSATGFAYIIFCFLTLLIFALPLSYILNKRAKDEDGQAYTTQHHDVVAGTADSAETAPATGTYGGFQEPTAHSTSDSV